ncbi:Sbal_3080 family lipoprotein [Ferrimonas senticii]|uniref:Sbal_3080 family lipoprotein n=1 Tax=Ferrimonas senticii TaxID=394566 RepID=UPI00040D6880|nr:Sbal_3080 family lipoprotein [Ferrimonas senticii]
MKKTTTAMLAVATALTLSGCAARQDITGFTQPQKPTEVCIAKHDAVRDGFLRAMERGFAANGTTTKVISASYPQKHAAYQPQISDADKQQCQVIAYYTANWAWDLATYLAYANIWVTDNQQNPLGQASYRTGGGLDKFIDAEAKVIELISSMYQ